MSENFQEWVDKQDHITKLNLTVHDVAAAELAGRILGMTVKELLIEVGKSNAEDWRVTLTFEGIETTLAVHIAEVSKASAGGDNDG